MGPFATAASEGLCSPRPRNLVGFGFDSAGREGSAVVSRARPGALDWNLDTEEMDALTGVSAPGIPEYLQGFLQKNAGMDIWDRLRTVANRDQR